MMEEERKDPAELQRAFNRLAGLLQEPEARRQMKDNPKGFLESKGMAAVPDAAASALSDLTPPELELFARVQAKLGDLPADLPGGGEVCIIF